MGTLQIRATWTLALALLFAPAAHAQDNDKIAADLMWAWMILDDEYYMDFENMDGWLRDDESASFDVYLTPGEYAVTGACDEDCTDVDLVVTGMTEAGSDRDMDDTPLVMFEVSSAGYFSIRVEMATCTREPCQWGVDVYEYMP